MYLGWGIVAHGGDSGGGGDDDDDDCNGAEHGDVRHAFALQHEVLYYMVY